MNETQVQASWAAHPCGERFVPGADDVPSFSVARAHKGFMHAAPLPVAKVGLARVAGWHLWVHLRPVSATSRRVTRAGAIHRRARRQLAGRFA